MPTRKLVLILTVALVAVACSDDTSTPVDSGPGDRTLLPDVGTRDSTDDVSRPDGITPDTTFDSNALADSGADTTSADVTSADTTSADTTSVDTTSVDSTSGDSRVDSSSADSTVDSVSPGPCAQGTEEVLVADQVVGCVTAQSEINQCAAVAYCGAGWHLCTASEYKARYGSSDPGLSEALWLAACVRDGSTPSAPTDQVCASCSGSQGSDVEVGWGCGIQITVTTDELNVGVRTSSACGIVGVDDAANQAYWQPWRASATLAGALCCK